MVWLWLRSDPGRTDPYDRTDPSDIIQAAFPMNRI